jgi:hypothetical protein
MMNQRTEFSSHSKTSAHDAPLALGVAVDQLGERAEHADCLMSDVIFKLRVNQLVTTLRATQHIDGEASTMLAMLESLVIVGEISFVDFMQRVQNLFPDVFDRVEPQLKDSLMRMLVD